MKAAIVLFSLALFALAMVEFTSAEPNRQPGAYEVKGRQKKSSSNIEDKSQNQKSEDVTIGGVTYEKDTDSSEYSKDYDSASASEQEETKYDDFGNAYKSKKKSKKTVAVDVDSKSTSTATKVHY